MNTANPTEQLADFEATSNASVEPMAPPDCSDVGYRLRSLLIVGIGLAWGGITAFSMVLEERETLMQAGALILACVLGFIGLRNAALLAWLNSAGGRLLCAHVVAAVISCLLSDGSSEGVFRYIALLPAFSLVLAVAGGGADDMEKVRFGLTIAGLVFVVFHFAQIEFGSIADPLYRITIFLNTNSTAFITAMTLLSALDLGLKPASTSWIRLFWIAVVVCCAVVLFGTKSRTALLALASGVLAFGFVRFRSQTARMVGIALIILCSVYAFRQREAIIHTLSLDEKDRSIATGTGRYEIWSYLLTSVIPKNPWLGVGPGQHNDLVLAATGSSNAHNALLAAIAETGILGTLPLLLITACGFAAIWRRRDRPDQAWMSALFLAGFVESLGENVFFSIGNPASLLFMVSVAGLLVPLHDETRDSSDLEDEVAMGAATKPALHDAP